MAIILGQVLLQKLGDKEITKTQLYNCVESDFNLVPQILEGTASPIATIRYGCASVLTNLSEKHPNQLYPYMDRFVGLLDSQHRILTWNALAIIANLTVSDSDSKFDALFDKYYSHLNSEYMVTVANTVANSATIAQNKPYLASDNKLTRYWRPFGKRPIPQALISRRQAVGIFIILVALTTAVIFTLPFPNSLAVFAIMLTCYGLEIFYQLKKRKENFPIAQVVGRIDFALFLVAGYLCVGSPDQNALLLFLFFYPLALAHLGVNDLIDVRNDEAKGMYTIPTLYSIKATANWILAFSLWHIAMAIVFLAYLGALLPVVGFTVSFVLISLANAKILKEKTPEVTIKALPMFHLAMLIYAITIIVNYSVTLFF